MQVHLYLHSANVCAKIENERRQRFLELNELTAVDLPYGQNLENKSDDPIGANEEHSI